MVLLRNPTPLLVGYPFNSLKVLGNPAMLMTKHLTKLEYWLTGVKNRPMNEELSIRLEKLGLEIRILELYSIDGRVSMEFSKQGDRLFQVPQKSPKLPTKISRLDQYRIVMVTSIPSWKLVQRLSNLPTYGIVLADLPLRISLWNFLMNTMIHFPYPDHNNNYQLPDPNEMDGDGCIQVLLCLRSTDYPFDVSLPEAPNKY